MSRFNCPEPDKSPIRLPDPVELVILPRTGDIGNFTVYRALPFRDKRMVGPFIFWDQMGPGEFLSGQGVDVRPHPHIGLSTLTYLFDGSLDHKDSLGNAIRIFPGAINLMTAGSGIVHSERTGLDIRKNESRLYGIQSWLAQPLTREHAAPSFIHYDATLLPTIGDKGLTGRVILGSFLGLSSPVATEWDSLYVELRMRKDQSVEIDQTTEERALYILTGRLEIAGSSFGHQQMVVLKPGTRVDIKAAEDTHLILLGGAAMDGPRYIWWNFVSSSLDAIKQAQLDWSDRKFPSIRGDETEFIPLPDSWIPK